MKYTAVSLLLVSVLLNTTLAEPVTEDVLSEEIKQLSYVDALILGLVEGITEYLPVSSTGHLIITNRLLGLDGEAPVADSRGQAVLVNDGGKLRPYTIGEAAYAYAIVIQAGAIAAVCILYWRTLLAMMLGFLGKDPNGRQLAINLIAAFLPAAIAGLLLDDWIEAALGDNVSAVGGALIVGAGVMLWVERWRRQKAANSQEVGTDTNTETSLTSLTLRQSIMIGIFQCFALFPGTSRSMVTIVGGYVAGLAPARAAEFSFLLGFLTLSAASGYKLVSDGSAMLTALQPGPVLAGCLIAFISAALAVKWLVSYLCRNGLAPFAWYRIVLAVAIFAFIQ